MNQTGWTAFAGQQLLKSGEPSEVALAVLASSRTRTTSAPILIFDDATGRTVDFDPRGDDSAVVARLIASLSPQKEAATRTRGRPKLGVVAKEVTLLPRHWDWLSEQPSGASAALRKLIEVAIRTTQAPNLVRNAQGAADRFMATMLGDMPGYEETSRALYAGDRDLFLSLTESWPTNLRDYARRLASAAFSTS